MPALAVQEDVAQGVPTTYCAQVVLGTVLLIVVRIGVVMPVGKVMPFCAVEKSVTVVTVPVVLLKSAVSVGPGPEVLTVIGWVIVALKVQARISCVSK